MGRAVAAPGISGATLTSACIYVRGAGSRSPGTLPVSCGKLELELELKTYRFRRRRRRRYRSFRGCHRNEIERTRGSRRRRLRDGDAPLGGRHQQLCVLAHRGRGLGRDRGRRENIWARGRRDWDRDRDRRGPRHVVVLVVVVVGKGVELEVENGTQGRCSWLLLLLPVEREWRQSSSRLQHLGGAVGSKHRSEWEEVPPFYFSSSSSSSSSPDLINAPVDQRSSKCSRINCLLCL
jgi:hypothetical protein